MIERLGPLAPELEVYEPCVASFARHFRLYSDVRGLRPISCILLSMRGDCLQNAVAQIPENSILRQINACKLLIYK